LNIDNKEFQTIESSERLLFIFYRFLIQCDLIQLCPVVDFVLDLIDISGLSGQQVSADTLADGDFRMQQLDGINTFFTV